MFIKKNANRASILTMIQCIRLMGDTADSYLPKINYTNGNCTIKVVYSSGTESTSMEP